MNNWLILDISTAAVEGVETFLTPAAEREPPGNYTKPESIQKWQAEDFAKDVSRAALDWDLARLTGLGWRSPDTAHVALYRDEADERRGLTELGMLLRSAFTPTLIGYNSQSFDWPILMRRARYLGISFPEINLDKYRGPHCDLLQKLSAGDREHRKSLGWYVRRMGWSDLQKSLTGAEEALVPQSGKWAELEQSLAHDVEAIYRLSQWLGVL